MRLFTSVRASVLAFVALGLFAGQASAGPITVLNPSFETVVINSPGTDICPITNWTCSPAADTRLGIYDFTTAQYPTYPSGVPNGTYAAYIGPDMAGGFFSQDTSAQIAANTTYSLSVYGGNRFDFGFTPGTISLTANGVIIASLTLSDPGEGLWASQTLTYANGSSFLNQTLGIRLSAPAATFSGQVNFDNVGLTSELTGTAGTFDATAVPEPTTLGLLGLGLALGIGRARRVSRR